jgi:hypothetical protein
MIGENLTIGQKIVDEWHYQASLARVIDEAVAPMHQHIWFMHDQIKLLRHELASILEGYSDIFSPQEIKSIRDVLEKTSEEE